MVVSTDKKTVGVISQVIGPVVDVAFPGANAKYL